MKKITVDVAMINEEGLDYLSRVFNTQIPDLMYLYGVLMELEDAQICLVDAERICSLSSDIVKAINDVSADHGNYGIEYVSHSDAGRKIVMDAARLNEEGHDYLVELFDLPEYYGRNLDALYDCLSEMEDTQIIIMNLDEMNSFSLSVIGVLDEVAEEYHNLKISYEYDELRDSDRQEEED